MRTLPSGQLANRSTDQLICPQTPALAAASPSGSAFGSRR